MDEGPAATVRLRGGVKSRPLGVTWEKARGSKYKGASWGRDAAARGFGGQVQLRADVRFIGRLPALTHFPLFPREPLESGSS